MRLLNFTHPLTADHLAAITALTGDSNITVREVPAQFDPQQPFAPQVVALADRCGLSPVEWQTTPILVNPPALNVIAVALLAELHGRMGYFAPVLRLRSVPGALPPRYEVAEVINVQALRHAARRRR